VQISGFSRIAIPTQIARPADHERKEDNKVEDERGTRGAM
jgi:hypothetical protein